MNASIRALLCVGLFLLAACSEERDAREMPGDRMSLIAERDAAGAPVLDVPADAPTVVFLGDSISAGLHLPAHQAFPAVLQAELAEDGVPFHLVNAGVSGDTSAGGLRRLEWVLSNDPDVLVVELGGNDGLRGQSLATIETNLCAIVRGAKEAGVKVLLLGMRLPTSYGAEYTQGFEELYERIAEDEDVPWVPFFMKGVGGVRSMNLEDGLHPSAEGHRVLADNVEPALRRLLEGRE